MNFYEEYCLPHLINCACGLTAVEHQRARIVPQACGHVLEVGMGSGLNLKYYDTDRVERVWGLEPSEGMRRKARKNIASSNIRVDWLGLPGEKIPLDNNSVDTVVLTYTLCTIPDWSTALAGMHRVLKANGKLLFCEHGEAPDIRLRKWQRRINPVWKKFTGGCNLNRDIPRLIHSAGFNIDQIEQGYVDGLRIAAYHYLGVATKK
jgi:ubiquinone/menaquinone biosynthesis C-methylase UbiE